MIFLGCSSSKATQDTLPPKPILNVFGGTIAYNRIPRLLLQDLSFEKTKGRLHLVHSFTFLEESLKNASNPLGIFQAVVYKAKCKKKSETHSTFIVIKVLDRMTKANAQLQAILLQLPRKIYFCYTFAATDQVIFLKQNFDKALKVVATILNKGSLAHYPPQENEYILSVSTVTSNHALLSDDTGRIVLYDFQKEAPDEKSENKLER